ncbi:amino acid transporter [Rhizodiscina lignyota]|uniref:Amino acid transporter n=1 Tax=Rhizodiscina lignyota TaxID=1504668 RepID=A0A9P4I4Q6_9PEZI|nr:amino acid transporter [Rhizodiscina lignyota]
MSNETKGQMPSEEVGEVALTDLESSSAQSPQKLDRYIRKIPSYFFDTIVLASWETVAVSFQFAIFNGGPVAMVYGSIIASIGMTAVAASLAELASIDPTVGAQYRWSAAYAPFAPKFWGLIQGWITVFAWCVGVGGPPAICAQILTSLASFTHADYDPKAWHTMMIMWGMIIIGLVANLWFRRILNAFEIVGGTLHVVFFFISIIVLLVTARKSSSEFVWTTVVTGVSGWQNSGVCVGLGLLTTAFSVSGADAVIHMADEVNNVRTRVPRSMMIGVISNGVMMIIWIIVLLYCIGNLDIVTAASNPLVEVYFEATGSTGGTVALVLISSATIFFALFNAMASVSRLIWAFAKDNGLPFSPVFARINRKFEVPLNALFLISAICVLLSIIYVASTTAFNAILSLQTLALNVSYVLPILFTFIRKLQGRAPERGPFNLGRCGILVNGFALAYLLFEIEWMPFPTELPVTGSNMNYAGPILLAVILIALADYAISGRKRFIIPVAPKVQ